MITSTNVEHKTKMQFSTLSPTISTLTTPHPPQKKHEQRSKFKKDKKYQNKRQTKQRKSNYIYSMPFVCVSCKMKTPITPIPILFFMHDSLLEYYIRLNTNEHILTTRRYMAEILPIRRKTLSNQSIY